MSSATATQLVSSDEARRERMLAELAEFFERETGHRLADPYHMPIEARVPERRRLRAINP